MENKKIQKKGGRNPAAATKMPVGQAAKPSATKRKLAKKESSSSVENNSSEDRNGFAEGEPGPKKSRGNTRDDKDYKKCPELKKADEGLRVLRNRALGAPVPQKPGRGVPKPDLNEYRPPELDEEEELTANVKELQQKYHAAAEKLTGSKRCRVQSEKLPLVYLVGKKIAGDFDRKRLRQELAAANATVEEQKKSSNAEIEKLQKALADAKALIDRKSHRRTFNKCIDPQNDGDQSMWAQNPSPIEEIDQSDGNNAAGYPQIYTIDQPPAADHRNMITASLEHPYKKLDTSSSCPSPLLDAGLDMMDVGLTFETGQDERLVSYKLYESTFRENCQLFEENRRLKKEIREARGSGGKFESSDSASTGVLEKGRMMEHNYDKVVQTPNGLWSDQNTMMNFGMGPQNDNNETDPIAALDPTYLTHVPNIESYREAAQCVDHLEFGAVESATKDDGQNEAVMFSRNASPEAPALDSPTALDTPPIKATNDADRQWPPASDCTPAGNSENTAVSGQLDTSIPKVQWWQMLATLPGNDAISACYGSPQ